LRSATYRSAPAWDAASFRRRGSGLGLAVGVTVVIVLVLLGLGASQYRPKTPGTALVVDLLPAPEAAAPTQPKTATAAARPRLQPRPSKPTPRMPKPLDMLILTPEEYAASDISKLAKTPEESRQAANDSQAIGRAPNGELLYGAEWARKPTDTELAGYLPRNAPSGWGLVACRTIAGHRVEDCVELENYPAGSRLAGAVRQAAWQFRVRPPRKNGRELVGAWVQIRIEYFREPAK